MALHNLRPRRHRAAEQRDELASFQVIEFHSIPHSQGRIAGYRIGVDQSGANGTILQPVSRKDHLRWLTTFSGTISALKRKR
jgi:hypothetical protein